MKKLFTILAMAVAMLVASSCDEQQGVVYNVTVDGQATGVVSYTIPTVQGRFTANGDLFLNCSNDTTLVASTVPLGAALDSEEADVAKAANETLAWVNNAFNFDGDYHVRIHGYVKYYGITFEIDEEYPKVVDEVAAEEVAE
jgi:hypothetical protein